MGREKTKLGTLKTTVSCNDWKTPIAKITVVADGFRPILGHYLFGQLGIKSSQKCCPKNEVNTIETPCAMKQSIAKESLKLILRNGKPENQTVNSNFHKNYRVTHQTGRQLPIRIQPKVKIELKRWLNEGHTEELSNCLDKFFFPPIVITLKKDHSIKTALDLKILNEAILKNKYQMPKIDSLIQTISQTILQSRLFYNIRFAVRIQPT